MSQKSAFTNKKSREFIKPFVRLVILLLLILFVCVWKKGLILSALGELYTMKKTFVFLCVLCSLFYSLLDGLAVSKVSGCRYTNGVRVSLVGAFYKVSTLGSANGAAEIVYLSRTGVPGTKGTGSVLLRYAIHKTAATLWGLVAFFYLALTGNALVKRYAVLVTLGAIASFVISMIFALLCVSEHFSHFLIRLGDWFFKRNKIKAEKNRETLQKFTEYGRQTAQDKKGILLAFLANLLKFIPQFLLPALVIRSKLPCNVLQITALTALAVMLSGVMVSPAGIGTLEYVFSIFFAEFASLSAAAAIVYRFFTMLFPFLLAIPIVIHNPHKNKQGIPKAS